MKRRPQYRWNWLVAPDRGRVDAIPGMATLILDREKYLDIFEKIISTLVTLFLHFYHSFQTNNQNTFLLSGANEPSLKRNSVIGHLMKIIMFEIIHSSFHFSCHKTRYLNDESCMLRHSYNVITIKSFLLHSVRNPVRNSYDVTDFIE